MAIDKAKLDLVAAKLRLADGVLDQMYEAAINVNPTHHNPIPKPEREALQELLNGMEDTITMAKARLDLL